jgi:pimeloyl-ACP methyl ester carboxylesterase
VLRIGSGEPLVLLHGVMGSERHWAEVAPMLAGRNDVIALSALGHRGGPHPSERPVTITMIIDAAERQMDELSIERAHFAGNSMGGWMALELARRGRALSVCALSPAGFWEAGRGREDDAGVRRLKLALAMGRATRPVLRPLVRSRAMRRFGLRDVAVDGARLSPARLVELTDDMLGCEVAEAIFATHDHFAPLDPLPCPITIAWSERDRVFPERASGACARERVPGARYIVLDGVGHVPMFDDPALVARTIERSVAAAH